MDYEKSKTTTATNKENGRMANNDGDKKYQENM